MKTTHLLIVLNVLVFAAMLAIAGGAEAGHFSTHTLLEFGALYSPLFRDGQFWRALTAVFIHLNPLHLAMNMIALYQTGPLLEQHYGRWRFLLLYLLAGLGGSAASLAWNWSVPVTSGGASGAICGLIGAGAVAGHLVGGPDGIALRNRMLRWALILVVYGVVSNIDNAAHAGGFAVGAAIAWLYDRGGVRAMAERARKSAGVTGLGADWLILIALVGGSFALAGRSRDSAITVEELINGGVELARAGKDTEAIENYRRALRMAPKDVIAHYDLALALARKHDDDGAIAEARAALAIDPEYYRAYAILADVFLRQGHFEESKQAEVKFFAGKHKDPNKDPEPKSDEPNSAAPGTQSSDGGT